MFRQINPPARGRRGMTLIEVLISIVLMTLLSIITVSGMIMHARLARSNIVQQRMTEKSRRFIDAVQIAALDSTVVRVEAGPSGAGTVLTLGRPDSANPDTIIYKQYAYIDPDNNPDTIDGNVIVERHANTPMATAGKPVVQYCSPVKASTPIFEHVAGTARPLVAVNLRVGDRTYPPASQDNAITGNGYQGFTIAAHVSQL